jgi:hypothetical protein
MTTGLSSAYTPLEALLLFQYLSNYGISPAVFSSVSDALKADNQIRAGNTFDPGRLSPDAIRDYFLRLLKEEARSEVQQSLGGAEHDGQNGDVLPGSRKRKARSPSLPTIQEAMKDAHHIPQLIRKLYARYREHAVVQIRDEERRYQHLKEQYAEIEEGAWDARLQKELDQKLRDEAVTKEKDTEKKVKTPESPPVNGPVATSKDAPLQPAEEVNEMLSRPQNVMSPLAPPLGTSPQPHVPVSQQTSQQQQQPPAATPRPPPNAPPHHGQSPALHQSPYAQQKVLAGGPNLQDAAAQSRPLPPPGMPPPPVPGPNYPSHPMPPYPPYSNDVPSSSRPPMHNAYPPPSQNSPAQMAMPGGQYTQQFPPHPPYSVAPGASAYSPQRTGGVMLQPFTVSAQTPSGVRQAPVQQGLSQGTNRPPLNTSVGAGRPLDQAPSTPGVPAHRSSYTPHDIARLLSTPLSTPRTKLDAPSPTRPDTRWKDAQTATKAARQPTPPPPRSRRSVSPISDRAPSPPPENMSTRSTRRNKQAAQPADLAAELNSRARPNRSHARRPRGGSTTSSVPGGSIRGRTRSQSVLSHAEDISMVDNDSTSGRKVKHEPSTPADVFDHVRPTIESTPSSGGPAGSTRRAALQYGANKRKRGTRGTSESSDTILPPVRHDKSKVLATRNFQRLSTSVINDILSHKHASLFSNPVREKDAEGYTTMIRRPQDLKSIKTAIAAGQRAVTAAAAEATPNAVTSSPRDAAGPILLPYNEDLVPPKGIVSSAQLEKEVMRMFTNAVMFNPGEDDVVQDSREMFEDAQQTIANFRSVERINTAGANAEDADSGLRRSEGDTAEAEEPIIANKRRRF